MEGLEIKYGADVLPIELSNEGSILISYAGPAGTVSSYSYIDVLQGKLPEGALRDRVVFVGPTAKIFQDYRQVPTFSQGIGVASTMTGVEIHANTYITLAEGLNGQGFLRRLSHRGVVLLTMTCGLLTALPCAFLEIYLGWIVLVILLPAYFLLSNYFFLVKMRLLPPFILPCAAIVMTYLAVLIHRYLDERRRRRRVPLDVRAFRTNTCRGTFGKGPKITSGSGNGTRVISTVF